MGRGNRAQGISSGAYFTTEFSASKTEDIEGHLKNKETLLHHAPEIIYQFVKKQAKINGVNAKKVRHAIVKTGVMITLQDFKKSNHEVWKLISDE